MGKLVVFWISPYGEALPVGMRLTGRFEGKDWHAGITEKGVAVSELGEHAYSSLSRVAEAAKRQVKQKLEKTNGWEFWHVFDPHQKQSVRLNTLRTEFEGWAYTARLVG